MITEEIIAANFGIQAIEGTPLLAVSKVEREPLLAVSELERTIGRRVWIYTVTGLNFYENERETLVFHAPVTGGLWRGERQIAGTAQFYPGGSRAKARARFLSYFKG